MKIPSRKMPQRRIPDIVSWWSCWPVLLVLTIPAFVILIRDQSFGGFIIEFGIFVLILIGAFIGSLFNILYFNKLARGRDEDNICSFSRCFDVRIVDTWVIRAVYEEIQDYCNIPIRASDRIFEDLRIDEDDFVWDLKNDIVAEIADRCGRSLEEIEQNLYYDKIITLSDLIYLLNNQPLCANSNNSELKS